MFLVSRRIKVLLCGLAAGSLSLAAIAAMACEDHKTAMASSGLQIQQAWSPTAPPTIEVHAGYFTILNHADAPQVIIGVSSPVYERVEMHRTTLANGVASMQAVDAITIAPGEQAAFAPGGLHLMLIEAGQPARRWRSISRHVAFAKRRNADLSDGRETPAYGRSQRHADGGSQHVRAAPTPWRLSASWYGLS